MTKQLSLVQFMLVSTAIPVFVAMFLGGAFPAFVGEALGVSAIGFMLGRHVAKNKSRTWVDVAVLQAIIGVNTMVAMVAIVHGGNSALFTMPIAFVCSWGLYRITRPTTAPSRGNEQSNGNGHTPIDSEHGFCTQCGKKTTFGARFCGNCGAPRQ